MSVAQITTQQPDIKVWSVWLLVVRRWQKSVFCFFSSSPSTLTRRIPFPIIMRDRIYYICMQSFVGAREILNSLRNGKSEAFIYMQFSPKAIKSFGRCQYCTHFTFNQIGMFFILSFGSDSIILLFGRNQNQHRFMHTHFIAHFQWNSSDIGHLKIDFYLFYLLFQPSSVCRCDAIHWTIHLRKWMKQGKQNTHKHFVPKKVIIRANILWRPNESIFHSATVHFWIASLRWSWRSVSTLTFE